jgi:hypothetical protein
MTLMMRGAGLSDIQLYRVPYQSGRGLGNLLSGGLKFLLPYIQQGVKFLGRELLDGGIDVLDGVGKGKTLKSALDDQKSKRFTSAANQLRKLQQGANLRTFKKLQTGGRRRSIKTQKQRIEDLIAGVAFKRTTARRKSAKKKPTKRKTKKKRNATHRVERDIFDIRR